MGSRMLVDGSVHQEAAMRESLQRAERERDEATCVRVGLRMRICTSKMWYMQLGGRLYRGTWDFAFPG